MAATITVRMTVKKAMNSEFHMKRKKVSPQMMSVKFEGSQLAGKPNGFDPQLADGFEPAQCRRIERDEDEQGNQPDRHPLQRRNFRLVADDGELAFLTHASALVNSRRR